LTSEKAISTPSKTILARIVFYLRFSYLCSRLKIAIFFKLKFSNMFAIVTIAGQQFKVEEGQEIFVHQLAANEGDSLDFEKVLLIDNGGTVTIGNPSIGGAAVRATVLGHQKGDKVIIFKKKRRKGYRKKNGHRQSFTKIKVDSIAV